MHVNIRWELILEKCGVCNVKPLPPYTRHMVLQMQCCWSVITYIHGGVDLTDGFVVCRKLINLDPVAHQLAHYLYFELVELTFGDCVRFGNDRNDVDLRKEREGRKNVTDLHQEQTVNVCLFPNERLHCVKVWYGSWCNCSLGLTIITADKTKKNTCQTKYAKKRRCTKV